MVRAMLRFVLTVSGMLLLLVLSGTRPARAEPLPYEATLQLGRPLHPVVLTFTTGQELTLGSAGKRRLLPAANASDVSLQRVSVASDAAVAIVRVSAPDGPWIGVLGGRSGSELLLFERAAPHGDPGEQRTREVAISGEPAVLRTGVRFEGVSLCAERAAWFETKRLDPASLTLVPDASAVPPQKVEQAAVSPAAIPGVAPVLGMLSAVASSELDSATLLPRVPRGLVDGDPAHGFSPRTGGFALMRWEGSVLPIERLELDFTASSARPVTLLWYGEQEAVVQAVVQATRGNNRVAITPPHALAGRCLALEVVEPQGLELRELYAYSDLDREGGVDRLIGALVQDSQGGAAAVDLLEKLGPAAADRLAVRWPELPARGRRRGLKVLARALASAPVRQRVLETAQSEDAELRERAIAVLERGGEPGRVGLRQLVLVPDNAGDLAARALAANAEELPALLAALSSEGGPARPALRKALSLAARKDAARARESATQWLASAPSVGTRAALALSFADAGDRDFAAQVADDDARNAQAFEDRYRFALALAKATPTAAGDGWLVQQAEHAEEWMQRSASLAALMLRASASVPAAADKLSRDAYPRVRALSLAPLAQTQPAKVEDALAKDAWPLVRAEAAHVLAARSESVPALQNAVADRSRLVRRAAIDALASGRRVAAWPSVKARLVVKGETLEVREAAIGFARTLCLTEAREPLHELASRVLSPDVDDVETQVALEALRALHDLGGAAARDGAAIVSKEGGPELAKLWQRLPPAHCERPNAPQS